jgi:low affinity Fe/Cu permease
MKNDFTTVILEKGRKRTQTRTLSAIDKKLKEEQTIYSKKNTKNKRITINSLSESSKGSKTM